MRGGHSSVFGRFLLLYTTETLLRCVDSIFQVDSSSKIYESKTLDKQKQYDVC